jgi:hypothetical protein
VAKEHELDRVKVEKVKQETAEGVFYVGGQRGRLFACRMYGGGLEFGAVVGAVLYPNVVLIDTTTTGAMFTASLWAVVASVRLSEHSISAFAFQSKRPIRDDAGG